MTEEQSTESAEGQWNEKFARAVLPVDDDTALLCFSWVFPDGKGQRSASTSFRLSWDDLVGLRNEIDNLLKGRDGESVKFEV